ncbi:DUF11 domain-containing protein [Diaphorobacter aerolatus]|uniref:DUF11 domain-containing protein n=1 Tax=Diaphorobacter aerolatus TaxID=1288495 RepID=A0A7H0GN71_9BURK|nr:DUF11 domain-containing protein [Diaphorobacter aerolatus]QNP49737.1 DUF11 domain-containing protein [Diaphorobacter aerolatus]
MSAPQVAAGANSLTLGTRASDGAGKSIVAGDLLLIIQMQDASINSNNSNAYGDGTGSGQGSTSIGNSGVYEFVTVTAVAGSNVTFAPQLTNTYRNVAATATSGKKTFQVIRVPQYTSLTANGIVAPAWNGATGGVVVLDVRDTLTLGNGTAEGVSNRAIFAAGKGFRGAAGIGATSGGSAADWAISSPSQADGGKGEGIAGTPRVVARKDSWGFKTTNAANATNLTTVDSAVEGYPNGSRARGAPANAGGGGSDGGPTSGINQYNAGGGGGGNYAAGGVGGRPWYYPLVDSGGRGGAGYSGDLTFNRIFLGGGGGAGGTNNLTSDPLAYANNGMGCSAAALCSSGAAGGGIVIIRANLVTGSGVIDARGASGYNVGSDAAGGGGAGGSVVIYSIAGGAATIDVSGGDGGNAWGSGGAGVANRHGPGGGGGGGFIAYSPAAFVVTPTVQGGTPGRTTNGASDNYGASGNSGGLASFQTSTPPGTLPGAACTTDLRLSKTDNVSVLQNGGNATYSVTATNRGSVASTGVITVVDVLPAGLSVNNGIVPLSGPQGTFWSCSAASNVLTCTSATPIPGNNGTSTFAFSAAVNAGLRRRLPTRPESAAAVMRTSQRHPLRQPLRRARRMMFRWAARWTSTRCNRRCFR